MRRHLDRIIDDFPPNARVLAAIWSSTPFFFVYLAMHGAALASSEIRQGLNVGAVIALQLLLTLSTVINVVVGFRLWPRCWQDEPADGLSQLVCLNIGLAFTVLAICAGAFTAGASLILVGVLAVGLMLFELRPMVVAYLVCVGLMLLHDAAVLWGAASYAPALGAGVFVDGQAAWWFTAWRQYVLYVGALALVAWLLLLFARLDRLHLKLTQLSYTDGLTGLANRRRFMEVLEAELVRQVRSGHELCLLLIDVDHFKDINDRHGHHAGDAVLRELAGLFMASVRAPADLPARLGGEEFAIVLPDTRLDEARRVAERLREQVATHVFEDGDTRLRVSVSIGLVAARGLNLGTLLQRADEALYRAKHTGRNRVVEAAWRGA